MSDTKRTAHAVWYGETPRGAETITVRGTLLKNIPYILGRPLRNGSGARSGGLVATAHAACYSTVLAQALRREGYRPERVETRATCTLSPQKPGGLKLTGLQLRVRGEVPGLDEATFQQFARQAEAMCPIANTAYGGPQVELNVSLT
jgi:osmotically inducible protein OsmC